MATAKQLQQRERLRARLTTPTDHVIASDLICASADLENARFELDKAMRELKSLSRRARRRGWPLRNIAAYAGVSNVAVHQWTTNLKGKNTQ